MCLICFRLFINPLHKKYIWYIFFITIYWFKIIKYVLIKHNMRKRRRRKNINFFATSVITLYWLYCQYSQLSISISVMNSPRQQLSISLFCCIHSLNCCSELSLMYLSSRNSFLAIKARLSCILHNSETSGSLPFRSFSSSFLPLPAHEYESKTFAVVICKQK